MSTRTTSRAMSSATSSQALEDGHSLQDGPDGAMIARSGPAPVHVSRFRALASNVAMPTNDTSGPLFTALSPSAGLQFSLESRLRARLGANGYPGCELTWRHQDMPAGPPSFRLVVSAPPIDVTGNGLLPTPSGTSNHGKNHVAGRIDEWGGSSNYLRGTEAGALHLPAFELWTMGFPAVWRALMPPATRSSRK
jgi:hypothetical protein